MSRKNPSWGVDLGRRPLGAAGALPLSALCWLRLAHFLPTEKHNLIPHPTRAWQCNGKVRPVRHEDVDQAPALMLVAQAEGQHPATIAQDYDIIQAALPARRTAFWRGFKRQAARLSGTN